MDARASTVPLASARDWQLKIDQEKQLKFPKHITRMELTPDLVLTSDPSRQVVMTEAPVPWEDEEHKKSSTSIWTGNAEGTGGRPACEPMEVGCRGFAEGRRATKNITKEKASWWMWIKRW